MGVMHGGGETPLSAVRPCGMGVTPKKALDMYGSPHLIILGSTASTPAPLGVEVPMVRPQHKPHHPGTPLSHTGTLGNGEGDHPPL